MWAHRPRGCGRSTRGCRQHRSGRWGRLGRGLGVSLLPWDSRGTRLFQVTPGALPCPPAAWCLPTIAPKLWASSPTQPPGTPARGGNPPAHTRCSPQAAPDSPSSQCGPVQPRLQEQLPLVESHRPPFLQEHACSQFTPNRFWGQPRDEAGLLRALVQSQTRSRTLPRDLTVIRQTLPARLPPSTQAHMCQEAAPITFCQFIHPQRPELSWC